MKFESSLLQVAMDEFPETVRVLAAAVAAAVRVSTKVLS